MKIKYLRLSKEEKKEVRDKFYKTPKGKRLKKYTNMSLIFNFLLLIYAIYFIIDTYINKGHRFYYIYGFLFVALSIIMIISIRNIRIKMINNYVVNKK